MIRDQVIAQVTSDDFVADFAAMMHNVGNVGIYAYSDGDVIQIGETVGNYLVDRWTGAPIAKLASCGCFKCDCDQCHDENYDFSDDYYDITEAFENVVKDIPYGYFKDEEL